MVRGLLDKTIRGQRSNGKYFIETSNFTEWVGDQSADWDAEYSVLQRLLEDNPESGKVMKGCGGLRKIRMADPKRGKGKRGGSRIIYLHIPEADCFCMIHAYGKDEKDDLTPDDRKVLAQIAGPYGRKCLRPCGKNRKGSRMSKTTQRSPFAERVLAGLNEIILHTEGKIKLKTYILEIADPPPAIDKMQVSSLRDRLKMSLPRFARLLNMPEATVRQWESGKRKPSGAAARLLQIYSERPEIADYITHGRNGQTDQSRNARKSRRRRQEENSR